MDQTAFNQRVVLFVKLANECLRRAQQTEEKRASEQKRMPELAKRAATALAENDRINSADRDEVAAVLATDHAQALEVLAKTAAHRNAEELAQIGQPIKAQKPQRFAPLGARVTNFDETEAGQEFVANLMGGR